MLKKLGQCLGLASILLVMSYGDLLGVLRQLGATLSLP